MDIKQRELKMQEKRKQTPWREFVMEIWPRFGTYLGKKDGIISRYPDTDRIGKVVSYKEFEQNRENLCQYGIIYNFENNFFQNFQKLIKDIPIASTLVAGQIENADYADDTMNARNVYLSFGVVTDTSNVLYSYLAKDNSNNILNSVSAAYQSENIYMSTSISSGYNIFFSKFITDSSNIRFSSNLIWCQECLFCDNIENQSYCIRNKQYDQETYKKEKDAILKQKDMFMDRYNSVSNIGNNLASTDVTGNGIVKSENIENGLIVYQVKNGRNLFMAGWSDGDSDIYDLMVWWAVKAEWMYGAFLSWLYSNNIVCSCHIIGNCSNIYYSHSLESCSYCLGCRWLKNKSFCILNKQYSKQERFELANKIFAQMDAESILWSYFPWYICPFYFNDTTAYLLDDSFTKEEVSAKWYLRRDNPIKVDIPSTAEVITTKDIYQYQWFDTDWSRKINPEILKKVIKDEKWNYYRIVPMELEFLQKHWLPLPDIHRLDRIKLGFKFK